MTSKSLGDLTPTCLHSFVSQIACSPALLNFFVPTVLKALGLTNTLHYSGHPHPELFSMLQPIILLKHNSRSSCFHARNPSVVVRALLRINSVPVPWPWVPALPHPLPVHSTPAALLHFYPGSLHFTWNIFFL